MANCMGFYLNLNEKTRSDTRGSLPNIGMDSKGDS